VFRRASRVSSLRLIGRPSRQPATPWRLFHQSAASGKCRVPRRGRGSSRPSIQLFSTHLLRRHIGYCADCRTRAGEEFFRSGVNQKSVYVSALESAAPAHTIWRRSDGSNPEKLVENCGYI
jgi:hypothetical protein